MDSLKLYFSVFVLSFFIVSVSSSDVNDGDDLVIRQVVGGAEPQVLTSEDHFSLFKRKFGKVYASNEEHDYRFSVFKANLRRARRHQKLDPSATHGVTQFSDLTRSEFRKKHLGVRSGFKLPKDANKAPILPTENLPEDFDWRDHGAVTPVKNQVFYSMMSQIDVLSNSLTLDQTSIRFFVLIWSNPGVQIRDLAALAGVSAPLELWKVLTSSLPANSSASANNSSSTVITRFVFSFS